MNIWWVIFILCQLYVIGSALDHLPVRPHRLPPVESDSRFGSRQERA